MTNTPTERLLVPVHPETTTMLGVGRSTVYNLIRSGELVRVNIGARALVTTESIRAYIDRLTAAAKAS